MHQLVKFHSTQFQKIFQENQKPKCEHVPPLPSKIVVVKKSTEHFIFTDICHLRMAKQIWFHENLGSQFKSPFNS